MTDPTIDGRSTVFVYHAPTMEQATAGAVEHIARTVSAPPLLLPSTLAQGDALMDAMVAGFRAQSTSPSVALPERSLRSTIGVLSRDRSLWRDAEVRLPDKRNRKVLLPDRLLEAGALVYVTHVNAVARTGPFLLDLLSRYVHRRDRLRQLLDPDRAGLAAEDNLVLRPAWCVVGCDVPPGIVAITPDLIAGELFALCVAERFFNRPAEFASPWEDRVVQRATELELGARIPGEIRIEILNGSRDLSEARAVRAVVDLVQVRIGIMSHDPTGLGVHRERA